MNRLPHDGGAAAPGSDARRRRGLCCAAAAAAAGGAWAAAPAQRCGDFRTDRFLRPAPHGQFGAFAITASGTSCATARSIARQFVFDLTAPNYVHNQIHSWSCTNGAVTAAQRLQVTCRQSGTAHKLSFQDEVPSG